MKKYAIFLGAGASASCNAPTQNNLLKEYFIGRKSLPTNSRFNGENDLERELATFFYFLFGIDVDNDDLENINFPTFEEALGIIDIALSKNESLKEFCGDNPTYKSENRLSTCRTYLIYLMASIIYDKLHIAENNHKELIRNLRNHNILEECVFISTNYDILIDNALSEETSFYCSPSYSLDYGFNFENIDKNKDAVQLPLFKLHGSLNWLYCPTCNVMTSTGDEKGVIRLIRPIECGDMCEVICPKCRGIRKDVIVPPTYFKQFSNYFINSVWFHAEQSLREVDKIIFCGYSFPDADMHIKYLLKKIETNRNKPLEVIVYNNYPHKKKIDKEYEKSRYNRFFINTVQYTNKGFETFIKNPIEYL